MLLAHNYFMSFWNGVRGTTSSKTFDELRMKMYISSIVVSLEKLPSTLSIIKEYLKRKFAAMRQSLILLNPNKSVFILTGNGWFIDNGKFFSSKSLKQFLTDLIAISGSEGKYRGRCKCAVAGQLFVPYCHKSSGGNCKNRQWY